MSRRRDFTATRSKADDENGRDPQYVVAVERGFDILRSFGADDLDLSNAEIVERTGLTKPTVSRLCNTLTRLGYLSYEERTGTYRLASGLIALAAPLLTSLSIRDRARPLMRALAEDSGASVALAAPAGTMMTYVEHAPGSSALQLKFALGSQVPMATTAMGWAYLSALDDEAYERTLQAIRVEMQASPAMERRIAEAREDVRRYGFCLSLGEFRKEINGVATPLCFHGEHGPLALTSGAPTFLLDERRMRTVVGPRLVEIARALGASVLDAAA